MTIATWEQTPQQLARTFAEHFGWQGKAGGWIYDHHGVPVAHGWSELAPRLTYRGWIRPGVGVDWRTAGENPRLGRVTR